MTLQSIAAIVIIMLIVFGCKREPDVLFTKLSPEHSQVSFVNEIKETSERNIMTYEYTYNGGGIAAGDFNNDGWCDLYFTGNMVGNKLYLNQHDLTFSDITEKAGVGGRELWKTGVTAVDVNADGWLDIYVCYSGAIGKEPLSNQLFINDGVDKDGNVTFKERAAEYGLDAAGTYSTQASFFDYDRDGDLDMFLINHGNHFYSPFINTNRLRNTRHPQFGNRLYRNDAISSDGSVTKKHFTEVSQEAGIHGGGINFSLGVSISDINSDGWPDIYVTNDYEEQDFLYMNNANGTFTESTKKSFGHLSRNGMGTDIADFNNDSKPDLIEVDMWPEDNYRQKLLKGPDDYNRYMLMVDSGFHYQQMRNTLQLNAGIGPDGFPVFCEIGQLAGVSATDWSWAPLFADFDNDGLKDLFVTNGYLRDFTSMDFLKYTVEEARKKAKEEGTELQLKDLVSKMPSTKTSDYIFQNNGDLTFSDRTKEWGLYVPNLSFGAAYADLDNDGDLEIITNNTNEESTIWKNNSSDKKTNSYLRVSLKGSDTNPFGTGAKIFVKSNGVVQLQEQFPARGFQSSVDPILHFGMKNNTKADEVKVVWADGKQSILTNVNVNQLIEVTYSSAQSVEEERKETRTTLFQDVTSASNITFIHHENAFNDFDREPLIPYQLSKQGPALAKGDVNGDGIDDFYIGSASGQSGQLFIGNGKGRFVLAAKQPWKEEAMSEDTGAVFFDADGDGDQDLFVVSGGNEFPVGSIMLDDRLYINQGKGEFNKAPSGSTIEDHASGSCVVAADYDRDGDVDLYVGGRVRPGSYPIPAPSAILKNESDRVTGKIKFTVATKDVNPDLREPGMITDATWTDFNGDGWLDLMLVGEWMPIRLFENRNGKLIEVKSETLKNTNGLWTRILPLDFDSDGDTDCVLGNAGSNLPWRISPEEPLTLYYSDFNDDGRIDPIICYTSQGKEYPVASRDELFSQVNSLRKKFTTYAQYANATIENVFDKPVLDKAKKLTVNTTLSCLLENTGGGTFKVSPFPIQAQLSSVNGLLSDDFDNDGITDILLSGNFYSYRTQVGRSDSGLGLFLQGKGKGSFSPVPVERSGFMATGDIRNMVLIRGEKDKKYILLARDNDKPSLFDY